MLFVTSDLHLFHHNIIKLCDRPYKDLEHMHSSMREVWNNLVQPSDAVYVVGDLCMSARPDRIVNMINSLNGYKFLIPGNHDKKALRKVIGLLKEAEITEPIVEFTSGDTRYVLCHYPIESWNRRRHGAIHLHGHTHGHGSYLPNRADVGWDVYQQPMPINSALIERYKVFTEQRRPTRDYHE